MNAANTRERIALIDLGSNSAHLAVMEVLTDRPTAAYHQIYHDKVAVRLSQGLTDTGALSEEAMARTLDTLRQFVRIARRLHVTRTLAVATASMRIATNGAEFRDRIAAETGLAIEIISGEREAELGYVGVANTLPESDFVVFDLGGASMEISVVRGRRRSRSVSLPIGALTLTEAYGTTGITESPVRRRIIAAVTDALKSIPEIKKSRIPVIGIGGTVRNLAKIHQRRTNYPIPKLHHYRMAPATVRSLTDELCRATLDERRDISGLSAERADIICAGSIAIDTLLRTVGAPVLIISGCGLREGLFFQDYAHHYRGDMLFPDDMVADSTAGYRATLPLDDDVHMRYVTRLTLSLYDALSTRYHLPERARIWLETAARLHDTGQIINFYSTARHSAYIIANAPLYGLTHREQAICAMIAGFQDGISNKLTRFTRYRDLLESGDFRLIKRLSVLLAIAKCLAHTHEGRIRDLMLHCTDNRAELTLVSTAADDPHTIRQALQKHADQFERSYRLRLVLAEDRH